MAGCPKNREGGKEKASGEGCGRGKEEGWEGEQRRKRHKREQKDTHFFYVSSFPAIRSILGERSHSMAIRVLLTFFPRISQQRKNTRSKIQIE